MEDGVLRLRTLVEAQQARITEQQLSIAEQRMQLRRLLELGWPPVVRRVWTH
jgi:hypothetical protein